MDGRTDFDGSLDSDGTDEGLLDLFVGLIVLDGVLDGEGVG
jgi:hypothetical protein